MSDAKTDLLASLLQKQVLHDQITEGTAKLVAGGVEGVQAVAQTDPEFLLAAITGLSAVISVVWTEYLELVERHFTLIDAIESVK